MIGSVLTKIVTRRKGTLFMILFLLFWSSLIKPGYIQAQNPEDLPAKTDTLSVLHGRMSVLLKAGTFEVIKTDQLLKMYSSLFNVDKVLCTDGFRIGENTSLTFYQTNIENFEINDGGLSTWKLIAVFTDKISPDQWLESGWNRMTDGTYMYFVKLVAGGKQQLFYKIVFYYIDNKFSFSLFQCPVQTIAINPGKADNFLSITYDRPRPKFTGGK